MSLTGLQGFPEVWVADFEFQQFDGQRLAPFLLCAKELRSGQTFHFWEDELTELKEPPLPVMEDALFVAYFASAEMGCFLSLGWTMPCRILDLYSEFRWMTNGQPTTCGNGLVGALAHFGLDSIEAAAKDGMRDLAVRGGHTPAPSVTR